MCVYKAVRRLACFCVLSFEARGRGVHNCGVRPVGEGSRRLGGGTPQAQLWKTAFSLPGRGSCVGPCAEVLKTKTVFIPGGSWVPKNGPRGPSQVLGPEKQSASTSAPNAPCPPCPQRPTSRLCVPRPSLALNPTLHRPPPSGVAPGWACLPQLRCPLVWREDSDPCAPLPAPRAPLSVLPPPVLSILFENTFTATPRAKPLGSCQPPPED